MLLGSLLAESCKFFSFSVVCSPYFWLPGWMTQGLIMKLSFQLHNCNGHCSREKNVTYFTACNNPGLLKICYAHAPFSQVHNRLLFYTTRQLKEEDSYKGVVLLSVIMLSVHKVDFLLSSSLRHMCLYRHTPSYLPPHAGSPYCIFVEEKWDVAWLESNLALKCSRHCPCYCSACLFMDLFVLWTWKKVIEIPCKK